MELIDRNSGMKYVVRGLEEQEILNLQKSITNHSYSNYRGPFKKYFLFEGMDFLIHFLEQQGAVCANDLQKFFYNGQSEITPYILRDNRIAVVSSGGAFIYENVEAFMSKKNNSGKLSKIKYLPDNNMPIRKITYTKSKKIFYYKLPHLIGKSYTQDYPLCEAEYIFQFGETNLYSINAEYVLSHLTGYNHDVFNLYKLTDLKLLSNHFLIQVEISHARKSGNPITDIFANQAMCGRNPLGRDFIVMKEKLIISLTEDLLLSKQDLDFSTNSIIKIEKALYLNVINDELIDKLFLPLLAYLGQYHVNCYGGEWVLSYDKIYETWIPDIERNNTRFLLPDKLLSVLDSTNPSWKTLRF